MRVLKSVFVVVGWLWENNENNALQPFVLLSRTRINKSRTGPCVSTQSITPQGPGFAALILRSTLKSERATRYITTHRPPARPPTTTRTLA